MSVSIDQQDAELFEAFLAGFAASGEGFNGEYISERYRVHPERPIDLTSNNAFRQRILEAFVKWRSE